MTLLQKAFFAERAENAEFAENLFNNCSQPASARAIARHSARADAGWERAKEFCESFYFFSFSPFSLRSPRTLRLNDLFHWSHG
jgi:hypothetical protein